MPRVPQTDNVVPIRHEPQPDPTFLAMATAMMHSEGKLTPQPKAPDDSRK